MNIGFPTNGEGGTINLPNAAILNGVCRAGAYENLLFPKAAKIEYTVVGKQVAGSNFYSTTVTEVLDLSGITGNGGNNGLFQNAVIGTLKLGSIAPHNNMFNSAKVTNLIWNNTDTTADKMGGSMGLKGSGASFTNAYLPDALRYQGTD